jgi:prophage regulatory protein
MKRRNQIAKYGIPEIGFMRLRHIIGDSKSDPPIPAIIPVSAASWWNGVKNGTYPSAVKISANITAWRVEDVRDLIDRINQGGFAA